MNDVLRSQRSWFRLPGALMVLAAAWPTPHAAALEKEVSKSTDIAAREPDVTAELHRGLMECHRDITAAPYQPQGNPR